MKTIFIFSFLSIIMFTAKAQDPQISSPTVSLSPGTVNGPVVFSVDFYNVSSVAITNPDPVNGPTQIIFSCNKFAPTGGTTPAVSGPGSVYFNWTAVLISGNWSIIGKQKPGVTIPGSTGFPPTYAGGKISIAGTITASSTIEDAAALKGDGFNANIIPGDGGDINVGSGSNNQSAYGYTSAGGPLPVRLRSFDAVKQSNAALLSWSTVQESNSSHFDVEHSADGVNFIVIGAVQAVGNTSVKSDYTFIDHNPITGNNYYRLKMVDKDGNYASSDIRLVNFSIKNIPAITVYPNPVINEVHITNLRETNLIQILSMDGKLVKNVQANQSAINIDMSNIAKGVYTIRVTNKFTNEVTCLKLLKN